MGKRYLYAQDEKKSREYKFVRAVVRDGAQRVDAAWASAQWRVDVNKRKGDRKFERIDGAKSRVINVLRDRPVGVNVRLVRLDGEGKPVESVKFFKVDTQPPAASTEGVLGIDRFVGWVNNEAREGRLHGVRYAGICVCKLTSGGTHSDHADCAAVDIFATSDSMERMRDEALRNADYYATKYAILYRTIWYPGRGPSAYGGDYHSHLHLSVNGGRYNSAC